LSSVLHFLRSVLPGNQGPFLVFLPFLILLRIWFFFIPPPPSNNLLDLIVLFFGHGPGDLSPLICWTLRGFFCPPHFPPHGHFGFADCSQPPMLTPPSIFVHLSAECALFPPPCLTHSTLLFQFLSVFFYFPFFFVFVVRTRCNPVLPLRFLGFFLRPPLVNAPFLCVASGRPIFLFAKPPPSVFYFLTPPPLF